MLTINVEIKSDGKRVDGTYNVKLRFTLGRKIRRRATSLFDNELTINHAQFIGTIQDAANDFFRGETVDDEDRSDYQDCYSLIRK